MHKKLDVSSILPAEKLLDVRPHNVKNYYKFAKHASFR